MPVITFAVSFLWPSRWNITSESWGRRFLSFLQSERLGRFPSPVYFAEEINKATEERRAFLENSFEETPVFPLGMFSRAICKRQGTIRKGAGGPSESRC